VPVERGVSTQSDWAGRSHPSDDMVFLVPSEGCLRELYVVR